MVVTVFTRAANGYDVDAWDKKNAMSIANVERIKSIENLDNLHNRSLIRITSHLMDSTILFFLLWC